jgi:hypothetical protein
MKRKVQRKDLGMGSGSICVKLATIYLLEERLKGAAKNKTP